MPTFAAPPLACSIHESTRRLRHCMDSLFANSSNRPSPATPEQMQTLLAELLRAGECLRARPAESDPELDRELAEYRAQVDRLRSLLPAIHDTLLAERARLEHERTRLHSASEWVRRSRQTL
jgi:hypothetical protein